jgi:predicted RNase H-like nuclease (RuvC/YqgF family)
MDQKEYQHWWQLHVRVAKGEVLNPGEQAIYAQGLKENEQAELLHENLQALRDTRATVARLTREQEKLRAEREELDAKIGALEAKLSAPARQALGV